VRFARFVHAGGVSFGVVEGDSQSGLTVAEIGSLPFETVRFTGQRWALADVRLLAPIFSSKVIGVGRNYADHAAEFGNELPAEPLIFMKPSTRRAPVAPITTPSGSRPSPSGSRKKPNWPS